MKLLGSLTSLFRFAGPLARKHSESFNVIGFKAFFDGNYQSIELVEQRPGRASTGVAPALQVCKSIQPVPNAALNGC